MDPNNSRPMSYENLKILLQYAKADLRFELFRRIPSIRLTEKLVPLRIDKLMFDYNGIEVNDTKYEAHTVRQFHPDFIASTSYLPPDDTFCNGDWDLDEWGFDDYSSETVFTPGDLVFQVQWQALRQKERSEERKREIENRLKFVEWMIARSFEGNPWSVTNTMKQIQTTFDGLITERSIKIPVNNFSQISVLYEPQGSPIFSGNILVGWNRRIRLMTIEVVPV
ncbi:hypothetical protein CAEBREN_19308 [Caenorhabditis brenneri]|uniref:Uncharacterized protein n=1 Tax=Caenorhabditis brenneri TaxID=135651 RepID=G0MMG1_CAEBE|nr:hypothetical protein CAEBREN_19308 [Caenorhabditis brenneri]